MVKFQIRWKSTSLWCNKINNWNLKSMFSISLHQIREDHMFQCRNQDFWLLYEAWWGWALILSLQPELRVFVKLLCIFISFLSLQNRPQAQIPLPTKREARCISAAILLSIYYAPNSIQGNERGVYDFTSNLKKWKEVKGKEVQNCVSGSFVHYFELCTS